MELWWAYLLIGAVIGFMAGLLGIGGGMLLVPTLLYVFGLRGAEAGFPPDHLMHMALATSMATIPFTSASSMRAHHVRGGVSWNIVTGMLPGLTLGALLGTLVEVARDGKGPRMPHLVINNILGILRACQRNIGIAMLPDYLVEENGGLVQLFGEADAIALDAFFVYPEELKTVARVQAFRDFLVANAQRWIF